MEHDLSVGQWIKQRRKQLRLTQAELAQKAGLTPAAVARIERNEAEPRMTTLRKLAEALGIEPHELVKGEDDGSTRQRRGQHHQAQE